MSVHVCLHFCCKILNKVVCCWTICHSGMEMESSGFGYAVFFLRQQMNCRVSGDLFISTKALFSQWLLLTCWPGAVEILLCRISVPQIAEQTHVHLLHFIFHSVLFFNLFYESYSICKGFKWDGSMNKTRQPIQSLSVGHLQWTTSYWVRAEATLSPLRNHFSWHRWQEKLVRDRLIFRSGSQVSHYESVIHQSPTPYKCPPQ